MKKILMIIVCLALVATMAACTAPAPSASAPAATSAAPAATSAAPASAAPATAKVIGYYKDAADDYYKAGFEVFKALATQKGWQVIDITGQGTAPEQVTAVDNFITQKVDAIVIVQNSPSTTTECLKSASAAKIPVFCVTQNPATSDAALLAGFVGFDWVADGKIAAQSAIAHNVKKVVIVEGKLGQGAAGGQTLGFLQGYKDAGKDIGDALDKVGSSKGGKDLAIVGWGSGGWFADPAKKYMADEITAVGANGFDGAYVENDEMMTGVLQAMTEAGLDTSKYWLGSSNGKEKSWDWVADGKTTMDVNQCPTLEADLVFQQVSAYFDGKTYKKFVFASLMPFEKSTVDKNKMIPWVLADYMSKRAANAFVYDLNNDVFKVNPDYK